MATTIQEDLLRSLRGNGGRKDLNFDLGQVNLTSTIRQGGQYQVQVGETPKTNNALQLAKLLQGGSQVLGNFVDLQSKQGEIEANFLSPQEVIKAIEQGDSKANGFLSALGKEKTFTENIWKRYYKSTVAPAIQGLESEFKNTPVEAFAGQNVTTDDDMRAYALSRISDVVAPFKEYASKNPYASSMNNMALEAIIPNFVEEQVASFNSGVTANNKASAEEFMIPAFFENGEGSDFEPTNPTPALSTDPPIVLDPNAENVPEGNVNPIEEIPTDRGGKVVPIAPEVDIAAQEFDVTTLLPNKDTIVTLQKNADTNSKNLTANGWTRVEAVQKTRKNLEDGVRTLLFKGEYGRAGVLLESVKKVQLGGQNVWSSQKGQLELAALEDSIDTFSEREYAKNERDIKNQVEKLSASRVLAIRNASIGEYQGVHADNVQEVNELDIPDSVKLGIIEQLDTMVSKIENKEFTKTERDDAATLKLQESSSVQQTSFGNAVTREFAAYAADNPTLYDWGVEYSDAKAEYVVKPEAQLRVNEEYVNVVNELSPLNYDMTQMIKDGTAFEYEVGDETIQFPASKTKQEKDALYSQLGKLHRKDLKYKLDTRLEAIAKAETNLTKTKENNLPPRVKEENAIAQQYRDQGAPEDLAKKQAKAEIQKIYGTNSLIEKDGTVKTNRSVFDSPKNMAEAYINDVASQAYKTQEQAEQAHSVAKFNSNIEVVDLIEKIQRNPSLSMENLKQLKKQFKDVGIPLQAVRDGFVTFDKDVIEETWYGYKHQGTVKQYYAIDNVINEANSESTYQLIHLNTLKNRATPEGMKSLQNVADRWYDGNVEKLVKGQIKWFSNRGIEIK